NRHPDLGRVYDFSAREAFGHDADDAERVAVKLYLLADDGRVSAEASHPTAVTQDGDGTRERRAVVFRVERAAALRADAEHVEVVARDEVAPDALVVAVAAETHRPETFGEDA